MTGPVETVGTTGAGASLEAVLADAVRTDETTQRWLYRANRSVCDAETYAGLREREQAWLGATADRLDGLVPRFCSVNEVLAALDERLAAEAAEVPTAQDVFLAEQAGPEAFRVVLEQYAVDGLVESQSHLAILPRLPSAARMAVLRVLIDEFGCGNETQEHARLYQELLDELGMPTDLEHYVQRAGPEALAYVNLFHWLAARAPAPEYFLGAYAYFESSVLYAFRSFAAAAARLGVTRHAYFTEHLYIDTFHARQMQQSIRALERDRPVDLGRVWSGVELTSAVAAAAFTAAVERARAA